MKLESQNFNSLHCTLHLCDGASLRTGNVKKSGLIRPNLLDFRKCLHFILKNEGKSSEEGIRCFHKVTDLTVKRMHSYLLQKEKYERLHFFFIIAIFCTSVHGSTISRIYERKVNKIKHKPKSLA